MPPKPQKSKAAKMLAAQSSSKKGKKKKWSKGKMKEKKNHAVVITKAQFDKMTKSLPKSKVITVHSVMDSYNVTGSVARQVLARLVESGAIQRVAECHNMKIFTKVA
eukprot:TRINITY_DN64719_c0_g3_i1.p2 TRINITY_DN64719_c0_g3~~TRINITY_DN64719_c0_g3_i1.p2  ORF type:complete len:107 (-),score=69.20 TRINITY_DN64719_c0_g3_i1:482-802(-)